jgi:thymidylate kinase
VQGRPNGESTAHMPIFAVEGPCNAGKTTLCRALLKSLHTLRPALVPCYADHVGGGRYLPRQEAVTVEERLATLRELLKIDRDRMSAHSADAGMIIADRSVHTLLANSLALQHTAALPCFDASDRLLREQPRVNWPTLVLYLDLPTEAVHARNHGKFPPGSIYMDPEFNAAFKSYFEMLAKKKTPRVVWLDATLEMTELAHVAEQEIRHLAQYDDIGETA